MRRKTYPLELYKWKSQLNVFKMSLKVFRWFYCHCLTPKPSSEGCLRGSHIFSSYLWSFSRSSFRAKPQLPSILMQPCHWHFYGIAANWSSDLILCTDLPCFCHHWENVKPPYGRARVARGSQYLELFKILCQELKRKMYFQVLCFVYWKRKGGTVAKK